MGGQGGGDGTESEPHAPHRNLGCHREETNRSNTNKRSRFLYSIPRSAWEFKGGTYFRLQANGGNASRKAEKEGALMFEPESFGPVAMSGGGHGKSEEKNEEFNSTATHTELPYARQCTERL